MFRKPHGLGCEIETKREQSSYSNENKKLYRRPGVIFTNLFNQETESKKHKGKFYTTVNFSKNIENKHEKVRASSSPLSNGWR